MSFKTGRWSFIFDLDIRKNPLLFSAGTQLAYKIAVLKLNESTSTKQAAQRMQQDLTVEIINTNRRTSDEAEGKRLYRILMDEE